MVNNLAEIFNEKTANKKTTIISFDDVVPVRDITLAQLDCKESVIAVFGDADLYAKISRGDQDYLVTWLNKNANEDGLFDIQREDLIFSESQIKLLGTGGMDIFVPWVFESDSRQRRFKELMEKLIGYLENGFSVEGFIETFGDEF